MLKCTPKESDFDRTGPFFEYQLLERTLNQIAAFKFVLYVLKMLKIVKESGFDRMVPIIKKDAPSNCFLCRNHHNIGNISIVNLMFLSNKNFMFITC